MQTPFDGPFKIATFPTQFPNVADDIGGCCNVPLFIPGQAFLPDAPFPVRLPCCSVYTA